MSLSLGELEALCRKAARGAGFDWGPAEEGGRAVRRLAAFALPGAELLLARLEAGETRLADSAPGVATSRALAPRSLDGEWRGEGGALCPILAGTALADAAARLDGGELVLHDVLAPLLLVPFAALAARQLGRPVGVAWGELRAIDDGTTLCLDGPRERTCDERTDTLRCRIETNLPDLGPLPRVTRARLDAERLARLDAFAQRTYAPATEESRLRGAGGARADDG